LEQAKQKSQKTTLMKPKGGTTRGAKAKTKKVMKSQEHPQQKQKQAHIT
jgi:hypothetical protein